MQRTRFLQLPLFEASDKPSILSDWNETVQKIDTAYANATAGAVPQIAEEIARLANILDSITNQYQTGDLDIARAEIDSVMAMLAPTFSADTNYSVGDLVVHYRSDDTYHKYPMLYQFTQAHTAGDPWNDVEVQQKDLSDIINSLPSGSGASLGAVASLFSSSASTASQFDSSASYSAGDYAWYDNQLYKCRASHTGAWDPMDFEPTFTIEWLKNNLDGQISNVYSAISALPSPLFAPSTSDWDTPFGLATLSGDHATIQLDSLSDVPSRGMVLLKANSLKFDISQAIVDGLNNNLTGTLYAQLSTRPFDGSSDAPIINIVLGKVQYMGNNYFNFSGKFMLPLIYNLSAVRRFILYFKIIDPSLGDLNVSLASDNTGSLDFFFK